MSVRLTIRNNSNVMVIDAFGKLASGEGRHSLHARLRKLAESGHLRILLNVSGVPSMDSYDIGELVAGHAAVTMAGGELKLLNPRDSVETVLQNTRISNLLDTYVDEAYAIRSFGMQQPRVRIASRCELRSEWHFG